jgi:hypothetical protein
MMGKWNLLYHVMSALSLEVVLGRKLVLILQLHHLTDDMKVLFMFSLCIWLLFQSGNATAIFLLL